MPYVKTLFAWTLFASFFGHIAFPKMHLFYFMPFLSKVSAHLPIPQTLLWAFLCGLFLDLITTQTHFGFEALLILLTLCVASPFRRFFFDDKPHAIILHTSLLSFLYTFLKTFFLAIFATVTDFSWKGICSEFIIMPLVDGIFGFFWFTCPTTLIKLGRKTLALWKHP